MEINPRACPGNRSINALRQIPSHGLTDQYRPSILSRTKIPWSHSACSIREKSRANGRESPWPGASHTSSGPAGCKQGELHLEQPVIRRQARQKDQRGPARAGRAHPVSDGPLSRLIAPLQHLRFRPFSPRRSGNTHTAPPCPHGRRGAVLPHNFDRIKSRSSCFPSPFSAEKGISFTDSSSSRASRICQKIGLDLSFFQLVQLVGHNHKRAAGVPEPLGHGAVVRRGLVAGVHDHDARRSSAPGRQTSSSISRPHRSRSALDTLA